MNHGNKINHLGRTASHRKAMLSNMAASLLLHKRINTTVQKAKALRKYVEPLITKAKVDSTHSRRVVFSYFNQKDPVKELFAEVAVKVGDRPGGYTRILRTGKRLGDNAEMCIMELVDYNETYTENAGKKGAKTRRGRTRRGPGTAETAAPETTAPQATGRRKKATPAAVAAQDSNVEEVDFEEVELGKQKGSDQITDATQAQPEVNAPITLAEEATVIQTDGPESEDTDTTSTPDTSETNPDGTNVPKEEPKA